MAKTSPVLKPEKPLKKLTPIETIRQVLREWYEPEYYASLYRQICYAFGETWSNAAAGDIMADGGEFPDFPAVVVRELEVGRSRRILNSSFVDLSRNMYSNPSPESIGVEKHIAEIRKQFYSERAIQGEWGDQSAAAFLDGNGVGVGFLQVGFKTNPETGLQRVSVRHSPTVFTLWDRGERSAGRADGICFIQHLTEHRAVKRFGEDVRKYAKETYQSQNGRPMKMVRIFEYYDIGLEGEATMAIIPQNMDNEPLFIGPNPFGCLPFSFYEHLMAPMMARPVGRIPIQMATQEAINALELTMRRATENGGFDIVDEQLLDSADMAAYYQGLGNRVRRIAPNNGASPVERIPGQDVSETHLRLFDLYNSQFNSDSGTNDYDRGTIPSGDRTKYEVQELVSRSAGQGGWSDKQTAAFMTRTVEKVFKVAALADRDPLDLDIFGMQIKINDPKEPRSRIANFLKQPGRVLVSEDSLRFQDAQRDRQIRMQQLGEIAPLVQMGVVDPHWYAEEMLRAIGEEDPDSAIVQPQAPQAPPQAPPGAAGPMAPQGPMPPTGAAPVGMPSQPGVPPIPQGP